MHNNENVISYRKRSVKSRLIKITTTWKFRTGKIYCTIRETLRNATSIKTYHGQGWSPGEK